jgi:aspartate aminotransferase
VALVPGSAFGADGYMRISFATGMDNLEKAVERIGQVFSG